MNKIKNYNHTSPIRAYKKPEQDAQTSQTLTSQGQEVLSFEEERELRLQYREFFGRGDFKFAIYPSHWKEQWGRPPLLGIVYADNEFLAERLAYDRGILPTHFNCTFQPKIKNLGPNRIKQNETKDY